MKHNSDFKKCYLDLIQTFTHLWIHSLYREAKKKTKSITFYLKIC